MSLTTGGASTDVIDHGTCGAVNHTSLTVAMWVYINTFEAAKGLVSKMGTGLEPGWLLRSTVIAAPSNEVRFTWTDAVGGTSSNYITNNAGLTNGSWYFIAFTFDQAASSGSRAVIYKGTLTSLATALTFGTATDSGLGFSSPAGENFRTGNRSNLASAPQWKYATMTFIENKVLTLGEIQALQFNPTKKYSEQKLYTHYGFNSTSTQADWSGNGNAGTVTGATQSEHVPLGPFFGRDIGWQGQFSAAGAANAVPQVWAQYRTRRVA